METILKHITTIERKKITPDKLGGVILAESDELMLLREVADFHFDGFVVIRQKDITKKHQPKHNLFHEKLMKKDGKWYLGDIGHYLWKVKTPRNAISSWKELLTNLICEIVIIEDERKEDFYLGLVREVSDKTVTIDYIDTMAKICKSCKIPFKSITQVIFDDEYSTTLARHIGE
jgi:hypothetical protein